MNLKNKTTEIEQRNKKCVGTVLHTFLYARKQKKNEINEKVIMHNLF